MHELERLGEDSLDAIGALVARALPDEHLTVDELRKALFGEHQPAVVRGDPAVGVVATVRAVDDDARAFVRLLAVDPDHRGRGQGRSLLQAAEVDAAGASTLTIGTDAPFFLFPGVPIEQIAMLSLLERAKFRRAEANFNMRVELDELDDDPGVAEVASPSTADEVRAFVDANYAHWTDEAMRALAQGSLLVSRDETGALLGFCALDVNRSGVLGPIAVRLDRLGHGDGRPLLLGALHHLRAAGRTEVDVGWVGPVPPYAAVGGRVSRVFLVYGKTLDGARSAP